jgi:hypothetical protein
LGSLWGKFPFTYKDPSNNICVQEKLLKSMKDLR